MKTGKDIVALAQEIKRQAEAKRDFIVQTSHLNMVAQPEGVSLDFADQGLGVLPIAHDQIGAHVGIPAKYYDKMLAEAPELLANNVNHWFAKHPAPRMVRTLDGMTRAFLSNSFQPFDNIDLAETVIPVLMDLGLEIMSSEITPKRLYIKAVDKRVIREIPAGHAMGDGTHTIVRMRELSPSLTIGNSEVGFGSLSILGGTFDGFCTNLATFGERSMRKYHVGSKQGLGEDFYAMLSDETRKLDQAAIWSKVRDVVRGAFDRAKFDSLVDKIEGTQAQKIEGDVPAVVEVTAKHFGMNDGERKSVLDHLIKGGDVSRFGLYNAITRTAEDLPSYDRATEFERFGGQLIELPANDWQRMAKAA